MSRVTRLMKRPRRAWRDSRNKAARRSPLRHRFGKGTLSIGGVEIGVLRDFTFHAGPSDLKGKAIDQIIVDDVITGSPP